MYQRVGAVAYKKDLDNTLALAEHLGHPEKGFKNIHVAGTNGKGSVSHMLASVLQESGYRVGLYTSPHLKDFRERIKINGQLISKQKVTAFIKKNRPFFEIHTLSFFEMTVGLAFEYFNQEKVDIAIIEVGMGGRLDSTNIILPELCVITNIGMDHTAYLGNKLSLIAAEKAGIIKPYIPVIIGETQVETTSTFTTIASSRSSPIYFADQYEKNKYELDLKGNYQSKNAHTAVVALRVLDTMGSFKISEKAIQNGLKNVVANTSFSGRWHVLQQEPKVICDTAHNNEGLSYVIHQLNEEKYNQLHIVLGFVSDKNVDDILVMFPKTANYYYCKPAIPRGMEVSVLIEKATQAGLKGKGYPSVKKAYRVALKNSKSDDLVFVGGSTFVVAEII